MRVMLLARGGCVHTQRSLQWLHKAGCRVLLVDNEKPPEPELSRISFSPHPRGLERQGRKLERLDNLVRYLQLRRLWARFRPDVVHLHNLWGRKEYDCFGARLKPLVLTCYGSDIHRHFVPGADPVARIYTRRLLRFADHVFADSTDILHYCDILARCRIPSSLMYFGIDTTLFRPGYAEAAQTWRQALAIPPNARVLFSVRAWRPLYRHELILEAFARAKARLPFPAVLVFKKYNEVAGSLEGAIYEEQIRARAETLGVHHDLRWLDSVPYEQLPALYSLSDLVVNFARVDGFPVSFIEAAACGKRVISNRLPPYGEAGLEQFCSMVPDGDVGQLAKGLVELLLERPERAAGKADLARKWGETQGDENRCIEKLMAVYNGLARQGEDRAGGEERSGR